jgi:hypothetical protein
MELASMVDTRELDDPEISALKDQLLSLVSTRGLVKSEELIRRLGWDAESYCYIGRLLVDAGVLRADGGKGEKLQPFASVARQAEPANQSAIMRRAEKSLCAPIVETLRTAWVAEHEIQDYVIDLTASQGGRITGGKWSRPDITFASSKEYKYVPGRLVELRTFEVKTHEGLDVTAVYEALSHRRAAHFAHVLAHVPECERSALQPILQRLIRDAEEYGVGVTTLVDPQDYKTWRIEVEARRASPDPADMDAFIRAQTGEEFQDKILSWCRRL